MKTLLILVLTASAAFGQTDVPGDSTAVTGNNIESLIETLKTNALPKSEFETTAIYEARRQTARKDGATFKFVLDAGPKTFTYDADSRMMQVSVPVEDHIFLGQAVSKRPSIMVHAVQRSERNYVGSNAFGAAAKVNSTVTDIYGVLVNQHIESPLLIPMDAVAAQSVKPFLRFGFICTLTSNAVVQDTFANAPTIDFPYGIYQRYGFVPVMISEIFVADSRDGKLLMQVHPGSADMSLQRDMRNKSFPITLEIRGIGAVYLSIDGAPEEMVQPGFSNETVMFRAKHQIHMKLSTRYDPLEFQLNGVRYKPKWVMNRSGIVEQPETVITAEQAAQVEAKTRH